MRRNTPKRARQERQYRAARLLYLAAHPRCELGTPDCTRTATEIQHLKGRIGDLLLDVEWWKACCHGCQSYAHNHPEESYDRGWMVRRGS